MINEFESFSKGRLKAEIIDPSKQEDAKAQAEQIGIPEYAIQAADASSIEVKKAFMGILLEYRDKTEVYPVIASTSDLEYQLILRLDKITRSKPVKVAFQVNDPFAAMRQMQGMPPGAVQDKHSPQTNLRLIDQMLGQQYETETLDLKSAVPAEVQTIVVTNGDVMDDVQKYYLDQYLMRGGNLIVLAVGNEMATMPGQQMPQSQSMRRPLETYAMDDLLSHWGVNVQKNLVSRRRLYANASSSGARRRFGSSYR